LSPPNGIIREFGLITLDQAIVVVVVCLLGLVLGFYLLRRCRRKHKNPKYVPTPFLKRLWEKWEPGKTRYRIADSDHLEPQRTAGSTQPSNAAAAQVTTTTEGVDRHTSVRSVMTLPAYHPNALQNEQVLAREGERGGIDVVIEFPEGPDEEEERREAEMEALYQVRLARRREIEEREERRRLRREARERGDHVALMELQARARGNSNASTGLSVAEARAEHERIKKERQRAISSVSYAALGIARHDGTRLRANSNDSERDGLLGDAAGMGSNFHRRDRSSSSILSIDTMNIDLPPRGLTRSRANSARSEAAESPLRNVISYSQQDGRSSHEGRAGSSPEMIDHEDIPPNSPPEYEHISLDTPTGEYHRESPPSYPGLIVTTEEPPSTGETATPAVTTPLRDNAVTIDSEGRRTSATHIGQSVSERSPSNASTSTRRSARTPVGVQGIAEGGKDDTEGGKVTTEIVEDTTEGGKDTTEGGKDTAKTVEDTAEGVANTTEGEQETTENVEDTSEDGRDKVEGIEHTPQLPSLNLPSLPSIQVDPGSPASRHSDHHPEE
jgi:hypothetical protein